MGRLSTIKPRKLEKAILKCGFIYDRSSGSSHRVYEKEGVKRPLIIPFHSSRDVPEFTVKQAIQASGLSKEKFLKLLKK